MQSKLMMSVSGVRGIVGDSLTPEVLFELTAAYARWLGNSGKIILGRDSRNTGPAISNLISGTLNLCGIDVIDIGLVPTPTVQLIVEKKRVKGGIIITASHNPIEWNALKFVSSRGSFLTNKEIQEVFELYDTKEFTFTSHKKTGFYKEDFSSFKTHIDEVKKIVDATAITQRRPKVLIDSVGGAGSHITPIFLRELGCEVVEHNTEIKGSFPRGSEPTPENIKGTGKLVREHKCDIGFCQDPDADRLALIDEDGEPIGEELTLAFAIQNKLTKGSGPVVINLSTSRVSQDVCAKAGVDCLRAPVGEINVVELMTQKKAFFGGEGNGGVIDPAVHMGRDSLVAMAHVLELFVRSEQSLSELRRALPQYTISKETVPIKEGQGFESIKQELKSLFDPHKDKHTVDEQDGLRFDFGEQRAWVHVRPSNTEPILRVISEAPTEQQTHDLSQRIIKRFK